MSNELRNWMRLVEQSGGFLYHATSSRNIQNIQMYGLTPLETADKAHWSGDMSQYSLGKVFLANSYQRARWYISNLKRFDDPTFFAILRISYNVLSDRVADPKEHGDYFVEREIEPQDIEIETRGGWAPLDSINARNYSDGTMDDPPEDEDDDDLSDED